MAATGYGQGGDISRVAKTGDVMTGPLVLTGNPAMTASAGAANGDVWTSDAQGNGSWKVPAGAAGALLAVNNLSDLTSAGAGRSNLGLGSAALLASGAVAQTANNLSDLSSAATARTNLGLGSAAVAATSAFLQPANNLSDITSAGTARANLGLGTAATANLSILLQVANNLSDVSSAGTARANLGLGSAATQSTSAFLLPGNNLSDVSSAGTARSNLGLGLVLPRVFDVAMNYGADITGATDCTTALNNATAACSAAGGGTIYLRAGKYLAHGWVIASMSRFTVYGEEGAVLWVAPSTSAAPNQVSVNALTVTDCTDFEIKLCIDGRRDTIAPLTVLAANASSGQAAVQVANGSAASYVAGQRLFVNGGLTANGGADAGKQDQNLTILNITPGSSGANDTITFTSNLANTYTSAAGVVSDPYGPYAANGAYVTPWQTGSATVSGRALTQEDQQNGIHLINCQRFRVSGCEITGMWESPIRCGTHNLAGTAQTDGCQYGTITQNVLYHCYDQGVGLWCSSNITVVGNVISAAGWAGICLTGAFDCTVTGNVSADAVQRIPGDTKAGYGIALEGAYRSTIGQNKITNPYGAGIYLTALGTIPFAGPAQLATAVASGSNNVSLPSSSVLANTTGFASSGQFSVLASGGVQQITYTGTTGTAFTGCTGGVGTLYTGQRITQYPVFTNNGAALAVGATSSVVTVIGDFQVGGMYSITDGAKTERIVVSAINVGTNTITFANTPTTFRHNDQCQIGQVVCEGNVLSGNTISGTGDAGIKLSSAVRTSIVGNVIDHTGLRGIDGVIWAAGGLQAPYGTLVSGNLISAPDTSGDGAAYSAIAFAQCSDIQIVGNRCGGAPSTQGYFIAVFAQAVTDSSISANLISDAYAVGMRLDAVNEWVCKRVQVTENTILRCYGEGLILFGGQGLNVQGNIIENCASNNGPGGFGGGLDVRGVQNSQISGNLVVNNGHGGLGLDTASINSVNVFTSGNVFRGNICLDDGLNYDPWNNAHVQQGYGIKELSTGQGPNTYDGNILSGNQTNLSLTSSGNTFVGSSLTPTAVQTGAYTAAASDLVLCNTTSGALTVTLPNAPADRTIIGVMIITLGAGNTVTVARSGTDVFYATGSGVTSVALTLLYQGAYFQYQASTKTWVQTGSALSLAQLDARYLLQSSLPLSIANGGTASSAAQAAINNLVGSTSAGQYLRGNGTNAVMSPLITADIPVSSVENYWTPMDHGMIGWSFDPATAGGNSLPTNGVIQLVGLELRVAKTITNLLLNVTTAGSALTANANYAALYNSNGTMLASTGDQSTTWNSASLKTMALTAAQALNAGMYWIGFVTNGATAPQFARGTAVGGASTMINAGLAASAARYATNGSAQTSLASITPSSNALGAVSWWAGAS